MSEPQQRKWSMRFRCGSSTCHVGDPQVFQTNELVLRQSETQLRLKHLCWSPTRQVEDYIWNSWILMRQKIDHLEKKKTSLDLSIRASVRASTHVVINLSRSGTHGTFFNQQLPETEPNISNTSAGEPEPEPEFVTPFQLQLQTDKEVIQTSSYIWALLSIMFSVYLHQAATAGWAHHDPS